MGVGVADGVAVSVGSGVSVGVSVGVADGLVVSVGEGVAEATGASVGINVGKLPTFACKGFAWSGVFKPPTLSSQAFKRSRLSNRKIPRVIL